MSDATPVSGVPLLDLKAQYTSLRSEIESAIHRVCESQIFIMGPEVQELESRVAKYCDAEFGIGVSSGTDALLVALMALDIGPGDEVITTPFTFFATGGVIARLGARPIFCDIERDTFNLDPDSVERFIESSCDLKSGALVNRETGGNVRVLMPVHLFGQTANMRRLMEIAKSTNLRVVEDAAQAIGSIDEDEGKAGSIGDIACFSFFPSKNLGAFGDAGLCTTNNPELAEKLRILRAHGGKPKYYHAVVGGNFRLDAIQAAVLGVKLKYLDNWTEARQANAATYDRLLSSHNEQVAVPVRRSGCRHIYNQYTIRTKQRDKLREFLRDKNIGTEIYYPVPLHLQDCFRDLGYSQGDCPESEIAAKSVLSIPVYPEVGSEHQNYVVDAISAFLTR